MGWGVILVFLTALCCLRWAWVVEHESKNMDAALSALIPYSIGIGLIALDLTFILFYGFMRLFFW